MTKIQVAKIRAENIQGIEGVKALLSELKSYPIAIANWADKYPYKPMVSFKIAHSGDKLFIHYFVTEQEILAHVDKDNGDVWTDSCVEFFINFGNDKYYNIEFNCIGRGLVGYRKSKEDVLHLDSDLLDKIKRYPSLGTKSFDKKKGQHNWDLLIIIPISIFSHERIDSFSGLKTKGNFYKCGDNLTEPHFTSWNPIGAAMPNFHLPEYFGEIEFD